MSADAERIDPAPSERKPLLHSERSRLLVSIHRRISYLSDKTDIHSHQERAQLNERLKELRSQ